MCVTHTFDSGLERPAQEGAISKTIASTLTPEHRDFYARFQSFWAAPTGAWVTEIIAPDAQIHFTGAGTLSGADYIDFMPGMLDANPEMKLKALDCAGDGDGERLYIFWETANLINGKAVRFVGLDRFRLANGMAIEEHVIFDSAMLQPTDLAALGRDRPIDAHRCARRHRRYDRPHCKADPHQWHSPQGRHRRAGPLGGDGPWLS